MKRPTLATPRMAYIVAVSLAVVVLVCQYAGTRILSAKQEASAVEINLAGRQRMLSQRIALTLQRLHAGAGSLETAREQELRSSLLVCAHLMEISHLALVGRATDEMSRALGMGQACLSNNNETPSLADLAPVEITDAPLLSAYTMMARDVALGRVQVADVNRQALADDTIDALLAELDGATRQAQERSIDNFRLAVAANWVFVICLVAGGAILVFRPLVRRIGENIKRLTDTNEKLLTSQRRLKDFAATGAHQFWETDKEHRFTWVETVGRNGRIKDKSVFLGRPRWEVAGQFGDIQGVDWDAHRRVLDSHKWFENFRYSIRFDDGSRMWWSVHGRPLFDKDGSFLGYRGTSREITAEVNSELAARQTERMQSLGKLTAGVAHDFNNMLAVVQGNAELMALEKDPRSRQHCVDEIVQAVNRGATLTGHLLAFGRVQHLHAETIDLKDFFESVSVLVERLIGSGFDIDLVPPQAGLSVCVDCHQLENAFVNLALNARDACRDGGRLTISAEPVKQAILTGTVSSDLDFDRLVCISFQDTGCGIPEEDLNKVIDPFYTTKPVGEGSGLGLSMVYGFALQSDGFVDLSSVVGNGTTIRLCLPMVQKEAAQSDHAVAKHSLTDTVQHVLLLEDDAAMRTVARKTLEQMGMTVTEASTGAEAVSTFMQRGPFDLMLADVLLPGSMTGVQAVAKIHDLEPDLPVLFMSGYAGSHTATGAITEMPGPLIRKPFSREELQQMLSEIQRAQQTRSQLS